MNMTKAERTRQQIIEKTAYLFNQKGFDGTTLADLTHATGLTKGSLYGNFRDKEEIALAVFKYSMIKIRELSREELSSVKTYKGKLIALHKFFVNYVMKPPIPGGCPLLNTAVEADDHHVSLRKEVAKSFTKVIDFMTELIEEGKKNNEFRRNANSRQLAMTMFCAIEGAIVFSRVSSSRDPIKAVSQYCYQLLDQISL